MASHAQPHDWSSFEEVFSDDDTEDKDHSPTTPPPTASPKKTAAPPMSKGPRTSRRPTSTPYYPEFNPTTKKENILRGGFGPSQKPARSSFMCYPPPSNAAYSLDSHFRVPKLHCDRIQREVNRQQGLGIDGVNLDIKSEVEAMAEAEADGKGAAPESFSGKTRGQVLADKMNFERPAWVTATPGASGPILPPDEQKRDFIDMIDQNGNERSNLELCYKCYERHIIPGSPLTLGDRDKCYSSLPDWFPRDISKNPWDKYLGLLNDIVGLQDTLKGYGRHKDPAKPQWDLHFHDKNRGWTTQHARRHGGWWRCRSGPEAPELEQNCEHCHKATTQAEINAAYEAVPVAVQLQELYDLIDRLFAEQGMKDKEAALAMLKSQGIPQHLGKPMDNAERIKLMDARGNCGPSKNRSLIVLDEGEPSTSLPTKLWHADDKPSPSAPFYAPTSSTTSSCP